ncbi:hypothetical protein BDZ88DRAFT_509025 [Geranomyces variabilis]|nr:hypothetical protein BDZ88DRAFT_509025 [Geranomyces variabilis]KAJ3140695.1 hypothetical protein HDU90_007998 [Geranomyces variabilis]
MAPGALAQQHQGGREGSLAAGLVIRGGEGPAGTEIPQPPTPGGPPVPMAAQHPQVADASITAVKCDCGSNQVAAASHAGHRDVELTISHICHRTIGSTGSRRRRLLASLLRAQANLDGKLGLGSDAATVVPARSETKVMMHFDNRADAVALREAALDKARKNNTKYLRDDLCFGFGLFSWAIKEELRTRAAREFLCITLPQLAIPQTCPSRNARSVSLARQVIAPRVDI